MFQYLILLLPTFICLIFAVLLWLKKSVRNSNLYLGLGFFFLGISFFSYASYYEYNYQEYVYMDIVQSFSLLVIPLAILYYYALFAVKIKLSEVLLCFIPPIIIISLYFVSYLVIGDEVSVDFVKSHYYNITIVSNQGWEFAVLTILNKYVFNAMVLLQLIFLVLKTFIYYNKYNTEIAENFYMIDDNTQYSSLFSLFSILIGVLSIVLKLVIINPEIKHSLWLNETLFVVNSFALFFLGQKGLFMEYIPKSTEEIESKETSFVEEFLKKKE